MINPKWLELSMSTTHSRGPKDVRVIEIQYPELQDDTTIVVIEIQYPELQDDTTIVVIFSSTISAWSNLRKHGYSNILKISPLKTESFQIKILIVFYISAQNIDCGTRQNRLAEAVLTSTHNLCF